MWKAQDKKVRSLEKVLTFLHLQTNRVNLKQISSSKDFLKILVEERNRKSEQDG